MLQRPAKEAGKNRNNIGSHRQPFVILNERRSCANEEPGRIALRVVP
jgi:hypothetical protein